MKTIANTTQNVLLGAAAGATVYSLIAVAGYAVVMQLYGSNSRPVGHVLI